MPFRFIINWTQPSWPRGLRCGSANARLLGLLVRIPPRAWSLFLVCCVQSGRGPCVWLTTGPEESYRVWCVCVRSRSLVNEGALAQKGLLRHGVGAGHNLPSSTIHLTSGYLTDGNKHVSTRLVPLQGFRMKNFTA